MKVKLINAKDAEHSKEKLAKYYNEGLIPAEKKSYLSKLKESVGPYMGIEASDNQTRFMLDAASQIATLGLGFNSTAFFGTSHFYESWTNEGHTDRIEKIKSAYFNLLKRKLDWANLYMSFCHSGAEANETALGLCYKNRVNKKAKKVVAFEGSFHGRMMVTLMSTWNKSKREPFEWSDYSTIYCDFPELNDDKVHVPMSKSWKELWANSGRTDFIPPKGRDETEELEIKSLLGVREAIKGGDVFALITEPMQCEGGDRYGSDRFFTALLLLCKSYNVSVVFDEVQTGFNLGHDFFWHKDLKLTDHEGLPLLPDAVTMAKKAQIGIVVSPYWQQENEQYSVASMVRGYFHALSIDQSKDQIHKVENYTHEFLASYLKKWNKYARRPRVKGLAFAFDLNDEATTNKFVEKRFEKGLLYYPAGSKTLRFRLNTQFTKDDMKILFDRLDALSKEIFENSPSETPTEITVKNQNNQRLYDFQTMLLEHKFGISKDSPNDLLKKIQTFFSNEFGLNFVTLDTKAYQKYRDQIVELEEIVYEPARQTDIELFDATMESAKSIAVALVKSEKLMAIGFAGPLNKYPLERGLRVDPYFNDSKSLYMLDTTLSPSLLGLGIGKYVKYAMSLLASAKGIERLQGRNRDQMAASMLGINLSLGSIEQNYIREDYPDFEDHRDVIYYTCDLNFHNDHIHFSNGINAPLRKKDITPDDISSLLPTLVNKICLSNFVSETFLEDVREFAKLFPQELRHCYTTSGQSEAVDKIAKTIWYNDKRTNKTPHMITFKGHYFGQGSFLARSLSSSEDNFFPVTHLEMPNSSNEISILKSLEDELKTRENLGVWLEPIPQRSPFKVSKDFLKKVKSLCEKYKTPLIFNETASSLYRYDESYFSVANEITPDAVMVYQGGQAGIVLVKEEHYLPKPLMLISTWDGDEHSLYLYMKGLRHFLKNKNETIKRREEFTKKLKELLSPYQLTEYYVEQATGHFTATLPPHLKKYFYSTDKANTYIVLPSDSAIKEFIER